MEKQQKVSSSFKISFGQEIRRISVSSPPPTFSQFLENVSQIFGTRFHPELKVQYVDEDNDKITVSTELEWNEALRYLEPFAVKKIFLSEGNGVFFKDAPPPVPLFFYKEESSKQTTESSNCNNNNNNNRSKKEAPKKGTCPRFGRAGPHFMHRKFGNIAAKHQRDQSPLDALKESVPRCLGIFFPDGKILPHHLPEFLKEAVQVKLIPNSENDVDLDVNIPLLRQVLFRRGLTMLDSRNYEEGRTAFLALVELSTQDPLAHYNLACAEALLGNHDSAVSFLSQSIECGYRNLAHLLADPDLDSLRNHSGYLKVVESLKALHSAAVAQNENNNNNNNNEKNEVKEEKKIEVKEEEKKSEEVVPLTALRMVEKKIEQPQQQPEKEKEKEKEKDQEKKEEPKKEIPIVEEKKKEEEKIVSAPQMSEEESKYATELQLLADMGFADRQANLVLLVANNGDLPNVIHQLF